MVIQILPLLTDQVVSSYPAFLPSGNGMVLLDMADEVLDSAATYQRLHQQMTVHVFEGGTIHAPA